jgi:uncharacterized FAD-dependent dehydrogenase
MHSKHVILALGHSARDTFRMLHGRGVFMEAKPFSVGFRIEHPQSLIDSARLGKYAGHPKLGAADYKLVHHAKNGRSVYSFCMCPGGTVVAATRAEPRGHQRHEPVLAQRAQRQLRHRRRHHPSRLPGRPAGRYRVAGAPGVPRLVLGGSNYEAPAQLVGDFIAGKPSTALGSVEPSYKPGVALGDLALALPDFAIEAIREACRRSRSRSRLLAARRGADRDRNPHLVAAAHHP